MRHFHFSLCERRACRLDISTEASTSVKFRIEAAAVHRHLTSTVSTCVGFGARPACYWNRNMP
uniref:SFRICE_000425 n=1 Tax=Spodoptera frugiperda TaxID=7108 RepID=A0A2H1VSP5_SPOFR